MFVRPLLAALTVAGAPDAGCPDRDAIVLRLQAAGVVIRAEDDVRIRFSFTSGRRQVEVEVPGAPPRALAHDGPDCSSLADATVALLSVLLDERAPVPPAQAAPPMRVEIARRVRSDAAILFSNGIVAAFAAGVTLGVAWRPVHWVSLGASTEVWPARDHVVREGTVMISASTLALVGCGGPTWGRISIAGCLLGHGGVYDLSAEGFPVVRPARRALLGGEAAARGSVALGLGLGLFARLGVWVPLSRLDVSVQGAESGFSTTAFGLKGAIGLELNR